MPKPHIVQCLCGPDRHCITAIAYEPGITAAQANYGRSGDITLTADNAGEYLRGMVDGMIELRAINPWCDLCRSARERWFFEDRALAFDTLEEALPALRENEARQLATRQFVKGSHN